MFSENLKTIRKAKGYTQEELAIKCSVVRQTVSKWEKGLSVPDVELLGKLADVLEVNVSDLLGGPVKVNKEEDNEIAIQLAKISEQMAIKNNRSRKIWKAVFITILVIVIGTILINALGLVAFGAYKVEGPVTVVSDVVEE